MITRDPPPNVSVGISTNNLGRCRSLVVQQVDSSRHDEDLTRPSSMFRRRRRHLRSTAISDDDGDEAGNEGSSGDDNLEGNLDVGVDEHATFTADLVDGSARLEADNSGQHEEPIILHSQETSTNLVGSVNCQHEDMIDIDNEEVAEDDADDCYSCWTLGGVIKVFR
ncbi:uncharacterized protein A4U43_C07F27940 [Asparagus officinalis]|uniref:Uncharacterized protein n=1 Tax=Asparagus officinalis TaxID=4686 RepID=A0A5P1EJ36_ASPOF|nr:uncharacterized protein A4U43_C07F27940 [Asparagus officinalis]